MDPNRRRSQIEEVVNSNLKLAAAIRTTPHRCCFSSASCWTSWRSPAFRATVQYLHSLINYSLHPKLQWSVSTHLSNSKDENWRVCTSKATWPPTKPSQDRCAGQYVDHPPLFIPAQAAKNLHFVWLCPPVPARRRHNITALSPFCPTS